MSIKSPPYDTPCCVCTFILQQCDYMLLHSNQQTVEAIIWYYCSTNTNTPNFLDYNFHMYLFSEIVKRLSERTCSMPQCSGGKSPSSGKMIPTSSNIIWCLISYSSAVTVWKWCCMTNTRNGTIRQKMITKIIDDDTGGAWLSNFVLVFKMNYSISAYRKILLSCTDFHYFRQY